MDKVTFQICACNATYSSVAIGVLGVHLGANGREEHVGTLLNTFKDEDTGLAGSELTTLFLHSGLAVSLSKRESGCSGLIDLGARGKSANQSEKHTQNRKNTC